MLDLNQKLPPCECLQDDSSLFQLLPFAMNSRVCRWLSFQPLPSFSDLLDTTWIHRINGSQLTLETF